MNGVTEWLLNGVTEWGYSGLLIYITYIWTVLIGFSGWSKEGGREVEASNVDVSM